MAGITQQEASKKIGVGYQRLRKLCSNGLARIPAQDKEDLKKICQFFGIKRTRLLWSSTLNTAAHPPAKYSEVELDVCIQKLIWVWRQNPKLRQLRLAMKWIDRAGDVAVDMLIPNTNDDGEDLTVLGVRDPNNYDDQFGVDYEKEARANYGFSQRRGRRDDNDDDD